MKRLRNPGLCPVSAFIDSAEQIISFLKVIKICILKREVKILGHIPVLSVVRDIFYFYQQPNSRNYCVANVCPIQQV